MIERIVKAMDPFLRRKVEIVAERKNITLAQAIYFLLQKVVSPT